MWFEQSPFREFVSVLRARSTDQFTENAERFASRRFFVSAFFARRYVTPPAALALSVS